VFSSLTCCRDESVKNETSGTIIWNESSLIQNKSINSYFNKSFFNDKDFSKSANYIVFIGQYRDTLLMTISSLKMDLNIEKMQPIGMMNLKGKRFFITMPISLMVNNLETSTVRKFFIEAIKRERKIREGGFDIRLIKVPMYSDTFFVIKERKLIDYYFKPPIAKD
jgi:hypothetical protein